MIKADAQMPRTWKGVLGRCATLMVAGAGLLSAQNVVFFSGLDAGARAGDARPNADAAAAAFDAAAAQLGDSVLHLLDFETVRLGDFLSLSPADVGVAGLAILPAGESSGADTSITDQTVPVEEGYNTTAGGSRFLKIEENQPGPGVEPPVGIIFKFATPVVAFGTYLTEADPNVAGTISALFDDGQEQSITLDGSPGGGVQFWGFAALESEARISRVTILASPELGVETDAIGIDDVRWVQIPEPGLTVLLLCSGLILARRRR